MTWMIATRLDLIDSNIFALGKPKTDLVHPSRVVVSSLGKAITDTL